MLFISVTTIIFESLILRKQNKTAKIYEPHKSLIRGLVIEGVKFYYVENVKIAD